MDDKEVIKRVLKKWGTVQGNLASDACCEFIAQNILTELEDEHEEDLGLNAYRKNRKQKPIRNDCNLY